MSNGRKHFKNGPRATRRAGNPRTKISKNGERGNRDGPFKAGRAPVNDLSEEGGRRSSRGPRDGNQGGRRNHPGATNARVNVKGVDPTAAPGAASRAATGGDETEENEPATAERIFGRQRPRSGDRQGGPRAAKREKIFHFQLLFDILIIHPFPEKSYIYFKFFAI